MVRALAIAATLAGVIVACSFRGQPVGIGPGDGPTLIDAAPDDGLHGDGPINPFPDAALDAKLVVDARLDAAVAMCDSQMCQAAGGSCAGTICLFNGPSNAVIICPQGESCTINCNSGMECSDIDCTLARSCTINCNQGQTCNGTIMCGDANCTIGCNTGQTCDGQTLSATGQCTRNCCAGPTCTGGTNTGCASLTANGC